MQFKTRRFSGMQL